MFNLYRGIFMKKFVFVFAVLLCFSLSAYSQNMVLGFSVGGGLPMGTFKDISDFGFGGTAIFGYSVDPNIMLTGRAGYFSFSGKEITVFDEKFKTSYGIIPILVGARYFFMPEGDTRVYGAAEIGLYSLTSKVKTTILDVTVEASTTESKFGFAPTLGAQFKAGDNLNVDVHVNYSYVATEGDALNWIGFGVGLEFGLGN